MVIPSRVTTVAGPRRRRDRRFGAPTGSGEQPGCGAREGDVDVVSAAVVVAAGEGVQHTGCQQVTRRVVEDLRGQGAGSSVALDQRDARPGCTMLSKPRRPAQGPW